MLPETRGSVVGIVTRSRAGRPRNRGSTPGQGPKIRYLFAGAATHAMRHNQEIFSPELRWPGSEGHYSSDQVPRLRMSGVIPPFFHMSSWRARGNLRLYISLIV